MQTYLPPLVASFFTAPPDLTLTTEVQGDVQLFQRNLARARWYCLKPKLLYLLWENRRQVQPNEFGRLPGPMAAAHIDKQERARKFPG